VSGILDFFLMAGETSEPLLKGADALVKGKASVPLSLLAASTAVGAVYSATRTIHDLNHLGDGAATDAGRKHAPGRDRLLRDLLATTACGLGFATTVRYAGSTPRLR
jgi:hypothetical protein